MSQRAGEEYNGVWQTIVSGSQFVSAVEIGDSEPTMTIDDVRVAVVESMDPGKGAEEKLIVYFEEASKGWIVNVTNGRCLSAMFGDNVRDWRRKRITLTVEQVRFGGKTLPGIRIKGSPDITAPIQVEIKMPRKRATFRELVPTGNGNQQHRQPDRGQQQDQWADEDRGEYGRGDPDREPAEHAREPS